MSILTNKLPVELVICGKKCPIKTDFKTWLVFSQMISENEFTPQKIVSLFKLIFIDGLPSNMFEAISEMMKFFTKNEKTEKSSGKSKETKQFFDFEADADLIYSAFLQQYRIDLCDENELHWWKFRALLSGLSENTHFVKAIQYRSMDVSKIKDKEQKRFYQKMKAIYKLPDNRSEEQKEQELNSAIEGMF